MTTETINLSFSPYHAVESATSSSFQTGGLPDPECRFLGTGKVNPELRRKESQHTVFWHLCSERPGLSPLGSKQSELYKVIVT